MKKTSEFKKIAALTLAVVLAGALLVSPKTVAPVYAGNASVQKYEEDIASLEAQQAELEAKISGIQDTQNSVAEEKEYLDALVSTVEQKIAKSEILVEELDTQIADAEAAIAQYEESISGTTERIKERMRLNQESGTESYIGVLIGSESIGDFLSRFERLSNMLEYDRENLQKYKDQKAALKEQVENLKASKKLQESTLETLEADKAESARLAEESAAYWAQLQNDKEAYQAEYLEAQAQEAALDGELSSLLQQIAAERAALAAQQAAAAQSGSQSTPSAPNVVSDGNYMWPLPSGGYISCYYGDTDPNGAPHYAIDCAISNGTPIYAANDGYVVRAEWHYSYGNYILIDHGNECATLYAHCSGLNVSANQTVSKGDIIGYVGSTGFSTGAHLHFEFRVKGLKTNPGNYMPIG